MDIPENRDLVPPSRVAPTALELMVRCLTKVRSALIRAGAESPRHGQHRILREVTETLKDLT